MIRYEEKVGAAAEVRPIAQRLKARGLRRKARVEDVCSGLWALGAGSPLLRPN